MVTNVEMKYLPPLLHLVQVVVQILEISNQQICQIKFKACEENEVF